MSCSRTQRSDAGEARTLGPETSTEPLRSVLANSEDQGDMPHTAAYHQGIHCLQRKKQIFMTEMHHDLESSTFDPLKHKMGNSTLILSTCLGIATRVKRVKELNSYVWFQRIV